MAFDTKGLIPYLVGVLSDLPGMQAVQRGEPLEPAANVNAYVLVGGQQPTRAATGGFFRRAGRFLVMFVVRVANEEDDAEDLIADLYDAFERAILSDMTAGGLASNAEIDTSPADNPDYRRMYGPEFRIYPVAVTFTQTDRITQA